MLTNPRNALRGHSRSLKVVPFNRLGMVSYCSIETLSLRRTVFEMFDLKNAVTSKSGSKITQGHRNRYISTRHLWVPINIP